MIYVLSILALITGASFIIGKYRRPKKLQLLFKPLTLIIIISIVIVAPTVDVKYKSLILTGLVFSLLSDFFLIYLEKHFVKGLVAFLVGHIFYIFAFYNAGGFHCTEWIYIPIGLIAILYLIAILPYTKNNSIPVIIYVLIISVMGWMAIERVFSIPSKGTLYAAIGATLFMISDSVLALNKFRKQFRSAEAIILSTYFLAQWLIALSVIIHQ